MVVSTPIADADYALISIVPHTTFGRAANFEIDLPEHGLKPGVFNVQALQPVSCHRFERRIGELSVDQLVRLDAMIRQWLAL